MILLLLFAGIVFVLAHPGTKKCSVDKCATGAGCFDNTPYYNNEDADDCTMDSCADYSSNTNYHGVKDIYINESNPLPGSAILVN